MAVVHKMVAGNADGADATKVRSSNWNADHTINIPGIGVNPSAVVGVSRNRYAAAGVTANLAPTTLALTAAQDYCMPYMPFKDGTIDTILVEVSTLGSGSSARVAIYKDDGTGKPGGTLVQESTSGAISTATTGVKSFAFSSAVTAGQLYWICINVSATAPTIRANAVGACAPVLGYVSTLGTGGPGVGWISTRTFAAFPGTWVDGTLSFIVGASPLFAVRLT